jgi:hypothetical protein
VIGYLDGGWSTGGGTSLGSPCWAGLIAIANQGLVADGDTTLNSTTNPTQTLHVLYSLPASDFHDITTGYNGYIAGPGYDEVTGRGTPIANLLIPDLVSSVSLSLAESSVSISASSIPYGNTATVTFTANNANGNQETSGGLNVVFSVSAGSVGNGMFSAITDNGNGTYTASFTGTTAGNTTITATIDGQPVTSPLSTVSVAVSRATPTVTVSDPGGFYIGSPFAATALVAGVVAGVDTTPASALENVDLTLDYQRLNGNGSTAADLGNTAPTAVGSYAVVAAFAGSADYTAASNSATFSIWPAGAMFTAGLYDASIATFYLQDSDGPGLPDIVVPFQPTSDPCIPLAGDWTGSGTTRVGLYDPTTSTFYLANANASGTSYSTVVFQPTADACIPIVGDWTGSGATTVGLYDPKTSTFYERDSNTSGPANASFVFGPAGAGWLPLAGNWTGSGATSVGLYNPTTGVFYLRDANAAGTPDVSFQFGPAGGDSIPLAGDWFGGGTTTVGLYNPQTSAFSLRNSNTAGCADVAFPFGPPGSNWMPIVGDWTGIGQAAVAAAAPQLAANLGNTTPTAADSSAAAASFTTSADYSIATSAQATFTIASVPPAFTLTSPSIGTFTAGQNVTIQWAAANIDLAGPTKISLGYDPDATPFDANQHWIEIDGVSAANGAGSYVWNTTGMAAGTYYFDGYMYDCSTGQAIASSLTTSIVIS